MYKFEIYTRPGCGWCVKAKQLFDSKSLQYNEHVIGVNASKDQIQAKVAAMGIGVEIRTVPQIFAVDPKTGAETYVGGYQDLTLFLSGA